MRFSPFLPPVSPADLSLAVLFVERCSGSILTTSNKPVFRSLEPSLLLSASLAPPVSRNGSSGPFPHLVGFASALCLIMNGHHCVVKRGCVSFFPFLFPFSSTHLLSQPSSQRFHLLAPRVRLTLHAPRKADALSSSPFSFSLSARPPHIPPRPSSRCSSSLPHPKSAPPHQARRVASTSQRLLRSSGLAVPEE